MADELDPTNENEEMGRTNEEDISGSADDDFEDVDDADDEEDEDAEDTESIE
jgi:hypothetical protein